MISKEAEKLLYEILEHENDAKYWSEKFKTADRKRCSIN